MTKPNSTPCITWVYDLLYERAQSGSNAPTVRQMTEQLHVDRDAITRSIRILVDAKMIETEAHNSRAKRRRYYITDLQKWTGYCEEKKMAQRDCITGCGAKFKSEGPHHRMCPACRMNKSPHRFIQEFGNMNGRVVPA